jgi:hypothetical protein
MRQVWFPSPNNNYQETRKGENKKMFCSICGAPSNRADARFCNECGATYASSPTHGVLSVQQLARPAQPAQMIGFRQRD